MINTQDIQQDINIVNGKEFNQIKEFITQANKRNSKKKNYPHEFYRMPAHSTAIWNKNKLKRK